MKQRIYKNNIVTILKELQDIEFQRKNWLSETYAGMTISFDEAINMLFDDSIITDLLKNNEIIIDKAVTQAFRDLDKTIDYVDDDRNPKEIINDPMMQIVREKATKVLELIAASDGSESTVDIIE